MNNITNKLFLQNINILYVEDEDGVRELTANILSKFVKNIIQASNGLEGLELFKKYNLDDTSEFKIDLIVTDISMPKKNGLDMIEEIQKIDSVVPSIITTAHNDAEFLKRAINIGVRGYVNKPLKIDKLIETIAIAAEPNYLKKELEVLNQNLSFEVEEKTIELRSILDSQENMILVLNEFKVYSANKTFLDFFNLKNIDNFIENKISVCDLFIEDENYFNTQNNQEWISDIMKLPDIKRLVRMKNYKKHTKIFQVNIKSFFYHTKHYVVSFTDITELQEYTYELQYKATHDGLTKLINRQKLNDELDKEILREARYKHSLSILMFDIDDFKNINDTYGHDIGDIVLIDISKILKDATRITDMTCRWGGEEFMVLLPETPMNDALFVAQTIIKNVKEYTNKDVYIPITISCGAAAFKVGQDNKESFIKNVDIALYQAKKNGKNQVIKYEK
jgi:diguanylate cyclase (GGDEF)-like protein